MAEQPQITLNDDSLIPQLGLGVWQASIEETEQAVLKALETGYRAIDTAAIYKNEQGVGKALQATHIPREDIFITTKLWNTDQLQAQQALETSLEKLKLDYVDLYLIHWPCPANDHYVEAWQQLIDLTQQGLIKRIGVCNFQDIHLQRLINETGVTPVVNQIELHPLLQQRQQHRWNNSHGIQTEAWSPLAQGGKGLFDHSVIAGLAKKYQKTPAQIVIRWHLDNGFIVIPKSVTPKRIEENFAVFDFCLSSNDLNEINQLDINQRLGPDPENFN